MRRFESINRRKSSPSDALAHLLPFLPSASRTSSGPPSANRTFASRRRRPGGPAQHLSQTPAHTRPGRQDQARFVRISGRVRPARARASYALVLITCPSRVVTYQPPHGRLQTARAERGRAGATLALRRGAPTAHGIARGEDRAPARLRPPCRQPPPRARQRRGIAGHRVLARRPVAGVRPLQASPTRSVLRPPRARAQQDESMAR
ncbi:hypothetical protein OF83DRAFT_1283541 [Amylostereum chailletii]|nr:hypothetical protein OF83DRAFT_1283541 [Amylostereum chailletii]